VTTVIVSRQARRPCPPVPSGELLLEPPPEIPAATGRQWTSMLTMLPMLAIMAGMMLMFSGSMGGSLRLVVFGLVGLAVVGAALVAIVNSGGTGKREMANARRHYLRRLAQQRTRLLRAIHQQREAWLYLHPEPDFLWSIVNSHRLWERRPGDPDFAVIRMGVGPQSPALTLVGPDTKPMEQLEPVSALALRRFLTTYQTVPDLPVAVPIAGYGRLFLGGDRDVTVPLVRAMLAQLATLHAPDELRIAVCAEQRSADWDWVKWLPHALHPDRADGAGPLRLVADTVAEIESMLADLLATRPRFEPGGRRTSGPQLIVVRDGAPATGSDYLLTDAGTDGVLVIDLTAAPPRTADAPGLVVDVAADGTIVLGTDDDRVPIGRADALCGVAAEALARQLAPLRLTGASQAMSIDLGLAELLNLGDPYSFDPTDTWVQRPARDRLRVPFGIQPDGVPIELDLKESAQDGMGPHGLLVGATGSGKSELLRTLVLALAVTHPPNSLNLVLIDFKGGAAFTPLKALPHTSTVVTNLENALPLVDRMGDALQGELMRRQELLRAAGNFASLRDYERARAAGAALPEVPTLLVIIDEFGELLTKKPDFINIFLQIGKLGRSLGVHLLLASQQLEEGRLRGLDTHLSYRIGLRTLTAMESRAVLGVTAAFELPRAPGHGLVKLGAEPPTRFRSAYVSGRYAPTDARAGSPGANAPPLLEYTTRYVPPATGTAVPALPPEDDADDSNCLFHILVERMVARGAPARQVWLPPLAESPTVDGLLGPIVFDPTRGLGTARTNLTGRLRAIVGVVDRPFDQRRDPLELDLSASAGHLAVVGGPRSGKSTALRTFVTSLALTHTPREVQFYCLDFGGGTLSALRGLPHVGGVAGRQNAGAVRRTVAQVAGVLEDRERRFAEADLDGIAAYRDARAGGEFADDPYGDVFLVVDGWQTLHKEFETVEPTVADIAARGLAYGVHVVVTCTRWFDLRSNIRDMFGSRVELRLGETIDTAVDRATADSVPKGTPGRGITTSKHHLLLALPRIDGVQSDAELGAATAAAVAAIADAWPHGSAPPVRLLPSTVPYGRLPARDESPAGLRLSVGLAEQDLAPVHLDFSADAHLLLLGDTQSGKTGFLRVLARRIGDNLPPEKARMILIDHRRGLLGDVTTGHLLGHGTDPVGSRRLISDAARAMTQRLPGPDVTAEQLRKRNWWRGPELFILVDDYDLVASPLDNVFAPLMEFLPQSRELGLHVVVTRRTGGAGRALFEPFLARLRDVGSPGLLLSGNREEGPLLGFKPESLPAGRGRLIARGREPRMVQLAWLAAAES